MTGYQNKVIHLAGDKQKDEVQLVVNLFQSVLDGFIRGEMKKEEAEPAKVRLSLGSSPCRTESEQVGAHGMSFLFCFFSPLKQERRGGQKIKV